MHEGDRAQGGLSDRTARERESEEGANRHVPRRRQLYEQVVRY